MQNAIGEILEAMMSTNRSPKTHIDDNKVREIQSVNYRNEEYYLPK